MDHNNIEERVETFETKNRTSNGLVILSYKYVKHMYCIKVAGFAMQVCF